MNSSHYVLYIFMFTQYHRFTIFAEKKEQPEKCRRKCDVTKQTNHSCCGLLRSNMSLHFWGGVYQAMA